MGQGTDSCGGWESEYDPYDDINLSHGIWTSQDGEIHVSKMSVGHLKNTLRRCRSLAHTSSFSDEQEKWESWVEILEEEIEKRECKPDLKNLKDKSPRIKEDQKPQFKKITPVSGKKIKMVCFCKSTYDARLADLKRGWGLTCSKRCAAIRREFGRPAGTEVGTGLNVSAILERESERCKPKKQQPLVVKAPTLKSHLKNVYFSNFLRIMRF